MCKLSVIMSTYREPEDYIRLSVQSILDQTFTDFEFIIVIDDPENTAMEQWLAEYAARDSRIRIVKNQTNLGLVGALNRALQEAHGEFVARMDADDISLPDRFEKELQYLQEHQLDLVGSLTQRIDENGNELPGVASRHYPPETIMHSLLITDCVPHVSWLLKHEMYTALHGYREIPRAEDYDFLLRALKAGFRVGVCDDCLIHYRNTANGISHSALLQQRLTAKYLLKNYHRLEHVSTEEIQKEVLSQVTGRAAQHYFQADVLFNTARRYGKRQIVKLVGYLLAALFTSRYQAGRYVDMLRLHRIRRQGQNKGETV